MTATVPELAGLPTLREAAARRGTVGFEYRGKQRRLDPYGLLLRDGFWYVVGRDHEHDEPRTYRVDRITGEVDVVEDADVRAPGRVRPSRRVSERPEAARCRRGRRCGGDGARRRGPGRRRRA